MSTFTLVGKKSGRNRLEFLKVELSVRCENVVISYIEKVLREFLVKQNPRFG